MYHHAQFHRPSFKQVPNLRPPFWQRCTLRQEYSLLVPKVVPLLSFTSPQDCPGHTSSTPMNCHNAVWTQGFWLAENKCQQLESYLSCQESASDLKCLCFFWWFCRLGCFLIITLATFPLCALPKKNRDKPGAFAAYQGSSPGLEKKPTLERNTLGLCIMTLLLTPASQRHTLKFTHWKVDGEAQFIKPFIRLSIFMEPQHQAQCYHSILSKMYLLNTTYAK